jgi:hypothetical protein
LLEETKLLGVSIVRKKGIERMSAGVSSQTSDQRSRRKEDLGLAISDNGRIAKITKRRGVFLAQSVSERVELSDPGDKRELSAVLRSDQMRQLFQQLSMMFNANTTKSSGIISNLSQKDIKYKLDT